MKFLNSIQIFTKVVAEFFEKPDGTKVVFEDDTRLTDIHSPDLAGHAWANQNVLTTSSPTFNRLNVSRTSGQPSIKASGTDTWMMIDSNGGYVGINRYVTDNVILAEGGGNVGIGTNSPNNRLDVVGDVRIQQESQLKFGGTGASDEAVKIKYNATTKSLDFIF